MLLQGVAEKVQVGRRERLAKLRPSVVEAIGFERAPDRIGVKAELSGNGADFPVFGVKPMTNPGDLLVGNHASPRKGIDPAPSACTNLAENPTVADLSGCGWLRIRHETDLGEFGRRRDYIGTGRESKGRWIRHARPRWMGAGFQTDAVFALAVAVIGTAFGTLLMAAVRFAALEAEGFSRQRALQ